tara:strand:- start:727 stop:999 length:273 start_codon:yes stop_codon:yes gene_type:complete
MLTYFIYLVVFLILTFVLIIAVKAIKRGIEAKENNKLNLIMEKKTEEDFKNFVEKNSHNLASEIKELNRLHDEGVLNEKEFKRAKEKILK